MHSAPRVVAVDHVADVGYEVHAPSLPELFHLAARALRLLLEEADVEAAVVDAAAAEGVTGTAHVTVTGGLTAAEGAAGGESAPVAVGIALSAPDVSILLAGWLRELHYLHEVHRLAYAAARFAELEETHLRAEVRFEPVGAGPASEIKGVTYHGLEVVRDASGWHATVIVDV